MPGNVQLDGTTRTIRDEQLLDTRGCCAESKFQDLALLRPLLDVGAFTPVDFLGLAFFAVRFVAFFDVAFATVLTTFLLPAVLGAALTAFAVLAAFGALTVLVTLGLLVVSEFLAALVAYGEAADLDSDTLVSLAAFAGLAFALVAVRDFPRSASSTRCNASSEA